MYIFIINMEIIRLVIRTNSLVERETVPKWYLLQKKT